MFQPYNLFHFCFTMSEFKKMKRAVTQMGSKKNLRMFIPISIIQDLQYVHIIMLHMSKPINNIVDLLNQLLDILSCIGFNMSSNQFSS